MAEKRLIDANALKVKAFADPDSGEGFVYVQDIDEAQTVDAVEVVRCMDCRYWEKFQSLILGEMMCCIAQGEMNVQKDPYDFCSYGERRTDG